MHDNNDGDNNNNTTYWLLLTCEEPCTILFTLQVTVSTYFIIPTLQMRKQRLREVEKMAYDPTANIKLEACTWE